MSKLLKYIKPQDGTAKDSLGREYIKNQDDTFTLKGSKQKYDYDTKERKFFKINNIPNNGLLKAEDVYNGIDVATGNEYNVKGAFNTLTDILNKKKTPKNAPYHDELLRNYLGVNNKNNLYQPNSNVNSNEFSTKSVLRLKDDGKLLDRIQKHFEKFPEKDNYQVEQDFNNSQSLKDLNANEDSLLDLYMDNPESAFGNYKIRKGKDKNGEYVSYYDKWDLNPSKFLPEASIIAGKPFEVYNKKYINKKQIGGVPKDGTSVSKTKINELDKQRINNNYLKSKVDANRTQLSEKRYNTNPLVRRIGERTESDRVINAKQDKLNIAALALAPVPGIGEIAGTANLIAQGVTDAYQGEYANAAMSAIPYGLGSSKLNKYLPDISKYNPFAKKLNNPDMGYRVLGEEGYKDAIESGVLRAKQNPQTTTKGTISLARNNNRNPNTGRLQSTLDRPYFADGFVDERYGADYVAEVNKLENNLVPIETHKGIAPSSATNIPLNKATMYKKDWLKGYEKQQVKSNNFKSEIDWNKWNDEIPNNKFLIDEYYSIEKITKSNGSWMKNSNGSEFNGTPEQFIQQNSSNFKKSFPTPIKDENGNIQTNYHGSEEDFNTFDPLKSNWGNYGYGLYTSPDKEIASFYKRQNPNGKLHELYINSSKPQQNIGKGIENNNEVFKYSNDNELFESGLSKKEIVKKLESDYDYLKVYDEQVTPFKNLLKSTINNNGMFDRNNSNIYKSVAPIIGSGIVGNQYKKQQQGGDMNNKVLAEAKEVFKGTDGRIRKVSEQAPTHDDGVLIDEQEQAQSASYNNGGVVIPAESVLSATHENRDSSDKSYGVLDEAIKIKSSELNDYALSLGLKKINHNKTVSPSKAFELLRDNRDKQADKLLKFKTVTFSDDYSKASAKANESVANMLVKDEELYDYLFQIQEIKKSNVRP